MTARGWARRGATCALLGSTALAGSACAPRPAAWAGATPTTWPVLREGLAAERARRPTTPWVGEIATVLHEPRSGRTVRGRGGIAVAPEKGVRLILLGVAGMTMLDAWVTPHRWRVAVPPAGIVRRGGDDAPPDLPIAFLRGWFFRPLAGTLFAASLGAEGPTWLLRDGDVVVEARARTCDRGWRLLVTRREHGHAESVDECRHGARPEAGDRVAYRDETTHLAVDLVLEGVSADPPPGEAFADPDAPEGP